MNDRIRPAASGSDANAHAFVRSIASPSGALVMLTDVALPADWPSCDGGADENLGHALGWTLEVRRAALVLLNPLGEGVVNCALPELSAGWLQRVRADGSCAIFLAPEAAEHTDPQRMVGAIAARGNGCAATVRSAVADDYGKVDDVGRNAPCPCGSGNKHKHCCGRR